VRTAFDEFVFDGEARRLYRGKETIHLTPKAFELMRLLIEARPRAIAKAELRDQLWPDVVVDEANLKNLVGEIRNALGTSGRRNIRTVQRYGYAFGGDADIDAGTSARLIEGERTYRLNRGENIIGRDGGCGVVIDFTGVSRHHAAIRVDGDCVFLEDLTSKNGTWKNDERVSGAVELTDGDCIRLGAVTLIFRCTAPAESTATLKDLER